MAPLFRGSAVSTDKGSYMSLVFRVWCFLTVCLSNGIHFATAMPNPPVKLTASDITPSSLKLAWKSGNADNVQSYIIQYKLKHDPGEYRQIIGIRDTEYMIERMLPYQQYELRVIAVTKLGQSMPSAPIEIVTGELAPGSPPRNVRARPHNPQTIMLQWDVPAIPNGAIQGYKVFYTTENSNPIVLWDIQDVNTDNRMATITGLVPNSTYTICVLAYSTTGQGPLSEPVQVMTRTGVPLQPRNLLAKALSPNELEITWSPPEDVDKISTYTLYYNDSLLHQNGQITIYPPTTRYKLTDLVPDTIYHIQLSARSQRGEGVKTILVQARTPEYTPSAPPQAVSGKPINSQTIEVRWRPPPAELQNGHIQGYRILHAKNEADDEENLLKGAVKLEVGKRPSP